MMKNYIKIIIGIVLILVFAFGVNLYLGKDKQSKNLLAEETTSNLSTGTAVESTATNSSNPAVSSPAASSSSNSIESSSPAKSSNPSDNSLAAAASSTVADKTAYITIDDGPSRNNTPQNLDTLKKYGIKATFFVLPQKDEDEIYKRILAEGHVIGNHSYSHNYKVLYGSDVQSFKNDVIKSRDYVYGKLGYKTTVFRFPGGTLGRKKSMLKERFDILNELGYKYFDWNVSTADTDTHLKSYGDEEFVANLLANNIIKNTKNRNKLIILMHDSPDKIYTVKALPKIIEGLKKQGYSFDVLTNY